MFIRSSRLLSFALVLLLWLSLSGCLANRPALTCPRSGGPGWSQLRSSNFVVETDQSPEKGRQIILDLEISRAALLAAIGAPRDDSATPLEVVAFERPREMNALLNEPTLAGIFFSRLAGDTEEQPVIVVIGGLTYETRATLQHELTHQILRRRTGRLPWWMDEGLSELFSTLRVESEGVAVIAEPPADVAFWEAEYALREVDLRVPKTWIPVSHAPDLNALLGADRESIGQDAGPFYAASWKLMHALRGHTDEGLGSRFPALMKELMRGTEGRAAFARAYQDVPLSSIEQAYRTMLLDDRERPRTVKFDPAVDTAPEVYPMSDAQVHSLWARLAAASHGKGASPSEQIDIGLAESPGASPLLYTRASIHLRSKNRAEARADIDVLLREGPDDPRYLLLDLLERFDRLPRIKKADEVTLAREDLAERAERLALLAKSPAQRITSALVLAAAGRTARALEISQNAVTKDPSCGRCFEGHAIVLMENGRPREARVALDRAIAFLPDNVSPAVHQKLSSFIDEALKKAPPEDDRGTPGGPD